MDTNEHEGNKRQEFRHGLTRFFRRGKSRQIKARLIQVGTLTDPDEIAAHLTGQARTETRTNTDYGAAGKLRSEIFGG